MLQGLALLESNQGNYGAAQQVFQQGADKCPPHAPLFNAWAAVEVLLLDIATCIPKERECSIHCQALSYDGRLLATLVGKLRHEAVTSFTTQNYQAKSP